MKIVTIIVLIVITALGIAALFRANSLGMDLATLLAMLFPESTWSYSRDMAWGLAGFLQIVTVMGTLVSDIVVFKCLWPKRSSAS